MWGFEVEVGEEEVGGGGGEEGGEGVEEEGVEEEDGDLVHPQAKFSSPHSPNGKHFLRVT